MDEKGKAFHLQPDIAELLEGIGLPLDEAVREDLPQPAAQQQPPAVTAPVVPEPEPEPPPNIPPEAARAMIWPKEPSDYIEPDWAHYMFRVWDHIRLHVPLVLMTGPRGTGKTQAAMVYAARQKKPLIIVNCHSAMEPESLLGTPRLDLKNHGGDYCQDGPFGLAAKYGAIVLMDEFNVTGPAFQTVINSVTDSVQNGIFNPYTAERINWPKPRIIIAVNEGYAGTREIQQAVRDRGEPMFAEYLPPYQEIELIRKRTGISATEATRAVNTANAIRAAARGENSKFMMIDFDLSPRALISYGSRIVDGKQTQDRAWKEAVIGRIGNNPRTAETRTIVTELSKQVGNFNIR